MSYILEVQVEYSAKRNIEEGHTNVLSQYVVGNHLDQSYHYKSLLSIESAWRGMIVWTVESPDIGAV